MRPCPPQPERLSTTRMLASRYLTSSSFAAAEMFAALPLMPDEKEMCRMSKSSFSKPSKAWMAA